MAKCGEMHVRCSERRDGGSIEGVADKKLGELVVLVVVLIGGCGQATCEFPTMVGPLMHRLPCSVGKTLFPSSPADVCSGLAVAAHPQHCNLRATEV